MDGKKAATGIFLGGRLADSKSVAPQGRVGSISSVGFHNKSLIVMDSRDNLEEGMFSSDGILYHLFLPLLISKKYSRR